MKTISASSGQDEGRNISWEERLQDHNNKKTEFLENCLFRGCTDSTVKSLNSSLTSVFNRVHIEDPTHPEGRRHLVCFDVLDPVRGSTYIGLVTMSLLQDDLSHGTRRRYMSALREFCAFVVEKPNIPGPSVVMVAEKYGPIALKFSRYDLPIHAQDRPVKQRYALALLLLHCLYEYLRKEYLPHHKLAHAAARDYAAIVLQAETGLRVSELLAIRVIGESCDVDWGTNRIRVFGKGRAYGGKRIRWVPLSPMSIAVLKVFIATFRPMFPTSCEKDYLFLDNNGRRFMPYQYARNFRKIIRLARQFGVLVPEDLRSHDLRRTFATNFLAENPMAYRKLLKHLGHTYPSSVAPYLVATDHDAEDQQSDLIDLFIDPAIDKLGEE
jgi:integrase